MNEKSAQGQGGSTSPQADFFRRLALLVTRAHLDGIEVRPTSYLRTPEEQKRLYGLGLTPCDGTVRKSKHQFGLAVDLVIEKDGIPVKHRTPEYEKLGEIWEALGGRWGGRLGPVGATGQDDIFHFETA